MSPYVNLAAQTIKSKTKRLPYRPDGEKGGESMPAIHYLAELDRLKAIKALQPIIEDMNEKELRFALLYVLHGMEIYEAIDSALVFKKICHHCGMEVIKP